MQTEARAVLEEKFALNQDRRCFCQQEISVVQSTLIWVDAICLHCESPKCLLQPPDCLLQQIRSCSQNKNPSPDFSIIWIWAPCVGKSTIALCKLERGGTNVSQPVFAAPCFPILSQVRHLSTLLPATSFIHLFSFLNKSEYGGWEEIIWGDVWTVKKYLKSMDSPIVVCLLRPPQALSQPPKLFAKFSTFSSRVISGREIMDRICAPRNNVEGEDSFSCMLLSAVSPLSPS